jgi:hypothetical protein
MGQNTLPGQLSPKLTGSEMGELRNIIANECFPNIGDFKEVLLIGLDIRYDNIARGGSPQEQVFNLIKDYLEPDDLIPDLLETIAEARPKNTRLQEFQEKYLLKNFHCEDNLLPLWDSLKLILRDIELSILDKVCRNILPLADSSGNIEISNIISLMKIFCVDYIYIDTTPTIIKFTQEVFNYSNIDQPIRNKLEQWLQNLPATFKDSIIPSLSPNQTQKDCFLCVLICPKDSKDQRDEFRVTVELIIPQEENKPSRYPIDLDQQERGSPCSFEEIPQKIINLMEKINDYLPDSFNLLTVEFFLPVGYLGENVEQWEIKDEVGLISISSVDNWRCVTRIYERIGGNNAKNNLKRKWGIFRKIITDHSGNDWQSLQKELKSNLLDGQTLLSNGDKFNLCLPDSKEEQKSFFIDILRNGIPFWLWYRSQDPQHEDIFNVETIKNLDKLKDVVYRKRRELPNTSSIGLLLEDPERWPNSQAKAISPGN